MNYLARANESGTILDEYTKVLLADIDSNLMKFCNEVLVPVADAHGYELVKKEQHQSKQGYNFEFRPKEGSHTDGTGIKVRVAAGDKIGGPSAVVEFETPLGFTGITPRDSPYGHWADEIDLSDPKKSFDTLVNTYNHLYFYFIPEKPVIKVRHR